MVNQPSIQKLSDDRLHDHDVEIHLQFLLRTSKAVNATIQWRGDRPRLESHVGT